MLPILANSLGKVLLGLNCNPSAPLCKRSRKTDPEKQINSKENPEYSLEEGLMRSTDQLLMLLKLIRGLRLRWEPG